MNFDPCSFMNIQQTILKHFMPQEPQISTEEQFMAYFEREDIPLCPKKVQVKLLNEAEEKEILVSIVDAKNILDKLNKVPYANLKVHCYIKGPKHCCHISCLRC